MRVIVDTNVLINCIGARTRHHRIWQLFLSGRITLCISTDILFEYEELVTSKYPAHIANGIIDVLSDPEYVNRVIVYYYWNAVVADKDDNKFYDAAVAANARYLVTNDTHFNEAKKVLFPKVTIISADQFLAIVKTL